MATKRRRGRKNKFLLRRVIIIGIGVLILYGIFNLIGAGLALLNKKDEQTLTVIPTTEFNTQIQTSESESTNQIDEQSTESTSESTTETSPSNGGTAMKFEDISYYSIRLNNRYTDYAEKNNAFSAEQVVLNVNMNLDRAFYEGIEIINNPDDLDAICNKFYALPEKFSPSNLEDVPKGYYVEDGKAYTLDKDAIDAFISMSDAAKEKGLSIKIISAYRSYDYQSKLYEKYKASNGQSAADRFSARPRHSEHETGLAIDINDVSQAFENTKEFAWLQENAHLYGYILRYPKDKEDITGYMYEPWHYRYLGVELATKVKDSGLTYDAYYAKYFFK